MAAQKFLTLVGGVKKLVSAITTSAGAGDDGKIPALDATGRLSTTFMPMGIGADTKSLASSENLASGNLVNVYDNAGTPTVRKADATAAGKEAVGFVLAATTSPANALVYFEGSITGLSGLTPGARYYLDTTAGAVTATPPSASGNVLQYIGRAVSASEISLELDDAIVID